MNIAAYCRVAADEITDSLTGQWAGRDETDWGVGTSSRSYLST